MEVYSWREPLDNVRTPDVAQTDAGANAQTSGPTCSACTSGAAKVSR
jgi:hypothetical protein